MNSMKRKLNWMHCSFCLWQSSHSLPCLQRAFLNGIKGSEQVQNVLMLGCCGQGVFHTPGPNLRNNFPVLSGRRGTTCFLPLDFLCPFCCTPSLPSPTLTLSWLCAGEGQPLSVSRGTSSPASLQLGGGMWQCHGPQHMSCGVDGVSKPRLSDVPDSLPSVLPPFPSASGRYKAIIKPTMVEL